MPRPFWDALQKSWARESCWPPMQPAWSGDNPASGNCLVSVLALWAETGFTGKIIPVLAQQPDKPSPDWHFQIESTGTIDPTCQQFAHGTEMKTVPPDDLMYKTMIEGSVFDEVENKSLRARLRVLLQNLQENGYTASTSANETVDRLEQAFAQYKQPAVDITPLRGRL